MFPIAAISYEIIRLGGQHADHPVCKLVLWPGLMTQRLTAREPSDEQLEVALEALRSVVSQEETLFPACALAAPAYFAIPTPLTLPSPLQVKAIQKQIN